ncbi:MAG: efflux RND transporter permease subunit [Lachnospiraceae bacterium]|nr:efflux RND transporter permease subunit [Lachnospiraceae bacterium]
MSKFSVKKPYTILIAVLAVLILGVVSITKMQLDLLPEVNLPYLLVLTTYPGASPEKVESVVTEPLEGSLGTITGVKNVTSFSYENYSMVQLEFEDDTNMDSALVKVTSAINTVRAVFPEEVGIPNVLELSADMLASMYLAISYEGKDIEELSRFVEDTLLPQIERQDGVADVSATGLIEKTVQVSLNQKKVDELNEKIKAKAQDSLDDARASLDDAKKQLEDGQAELDKGKKEMADGQAKIDSGKAELEKGKEELEKQQKETYEQLAQASLALDQLSSYQSQLVTQQAQEAVLKTAIEEAGKALAAYGISVDDLDSTVSTMETGLTTATNSISTMDQLITLADAIAADPTLATQDSTTVPGQTNGQVLGLGLATLATAIPDLATLSTGYNAAYAAYAADPSNPKDATLTATYVGAVTASSGALTTAKAATQAQVDTLNASLPQLKTAQQTINSYKSELTALEVEIEVTKGIVAKFEDELKKLGVSYTDIEAAKMQAAAGFAAAQAQLATGASALETAQAQLDAGKTQMDSAKEQLESGWESYNDAEKTFEDQSKTALESANADGLLSLDTISALIYAQNFEMPAGYIDDKDDNSWLLKIGNNYDSVEDLGNMLLASIDGIGDITLDSVADITVIDNSGTTYARLNNRSAVILSVYKASTTGTNEVSRTLRSEIKELEDRYEGLDILVMVDQGDYIEIIIKSVMQSMILGAALAVIILAFFLKDVMPTIVVAISIPLSVLLSLVAMYFSGISLNMMSLSGMALGIGMLVDNSIVIIENIYRLRGRGINAPRAAVQGTNQVAGAVVASTLTSVCVFFPMVYTTGMVRSLMLPMALTIIYCLLASLLVAMTVVPAASSTLLRKTKPKSHKVFDKIQNLYGKVLAFCLKVKVVPLAVAVLLLGISVWQVFRMGIVMIPELTSNQIQATVSFDEEELSREEAYGLVDELIYRTVEVPGVASVGSMSGSGEALFGFGGGDGAYNSFSLMISTENERAGAGEVKKITDSFYDIAEELGIDVSVSGGLDEMGAILGSGLSISIYGQDLETLRKISEDLMEIVSQVDGYVDISNGQEEADKVLHLDVDKDKAIKYGVTVAQIYQAVAAEMATTKNAITVTVDGVDMKVDIVDELDPVTAENLLDIAIPVTPPEEKSEDDDKETKTETKSSSLAGASGEFSASMGGNGGFSSAFGGSGFGSAMGGSGMSTQASAQETRPLSEFATLSFEDGYNSISRENQTRYITVTAGVAEGENETLLSRKLRPLLDKYEVPDGYTIDMGGESEATMKMVKDMMPIFLMGIAFIYFVMVAQFQSLLSPFIVLFTLPLAYTGGFMSLWFTGENISMMALMGFIVLTGTVVNNGIVYVDYTNQLRMGGMERRDALIATGKTRMRPILMTALTTILAEASLIFGDDMGSQMGRAMALVIAGGLLYATLMTLFIIPVMYDILFKKPPLNVDVGGDNIDDIPDDAKEFMLQIEAEKAEKALSKEE